MCKIAAFYEGGVSWSELSQMPLDQFFRISENAVQIADLRKRQAEKMRNG